MQREQVKINEGRQATSCFTSLLRPYQDSLEKGWFPDHHEVNISMKILMILCKL